MKLNTEDRQRVVRLFETYEKMNDALTAIDEFPSFLEVKSAKVVVIEKELARTVVEKQRDRIVGELAGLGIEVD